MERSYEVVRASPSVQRTMRLGWGTGGLEEPGMTALGERGIGSKAAGSGIGIGWVLVELDKKARAARCCS